MNNEQLAMINVQCSMMPSHRTARSGCMCARMLLSGIQFDRLVDSRLRGNDAARPSCPSASVGHPRLIRYGFRPPQAGRLRGNTCTHRRCGVTLRVVISNGGCTITNCTTVISNGDCAITNCTTVIDNGDYAIANCAVIINNGDHANLNAGSAISTGICAIDDGNSSPFVLTSRKTR